jgi:hypothetical protein
VVDEWDFWDNSFRMNQGKLSAARFVLIPVLLLLSGIVLLQTQQIQAQEIQAQQGFLTVGYEQTFHGSEPEHYIISITSDCHGTYQSEQNLAEDSFHFDFMMAPANCAKIFDLAKQANYFQGKIDSKKKNIASTGIKTLSYKDSERNTRATYNYSLMPAIQEVTRVFQSLGAMMEFGRRLEYDHRYQKLALDEDLKRIEDSSGVNGLEDISAIAAVLQKIIDDPSLMNVVRARAQRILAGAK